MEEKPSAPWSSYKKDKDLDARLKRNKEYLKSKKQKRQFSRGTAPGRGKGEGVLLSTSRKYSSLRAVASGEIKPIPFQCEIIKTLDRDKHNPLNNKVFSDLSLSEQLEVLKKKDKKRHIYSDDEESDYTKNEAKDEEEMERKGDAERVGGSKEKEKTKEEKSQRMASRESSKDNLQKETNKERNEIKKSVEVMEPKEAKKDKTERISIRHPVKLKIDEISENFSHITFCKLDRLSKAVHHANLDIPNSKNNDYNRVDNAITKWSLKL